MLTMSIDMWNTVLRLILALLTQNPDTVAGGNPYQLVDNIYHILSSIGYVILVLSYLTGVAREVTDVRQLRRPEWIVMSLFRLIVAQMIMANGLTLLRGIYAFFIRIINAVFSTSVQLQPLTTLSDTLTQQIKDLDWFSATGLMPIAILFLLLMVAISIFMIILAYMRFFRLFLLMAMAPIFLGTLGGGVLGNSGKEYLRNHVSICMEGVALVVACLLYSAFLSGGLPSLLPESTIPFVRILAFMVTSAMHAILLCAMVKGIDALMKQLVQLSHA